MNRRDFIKAGTGAFFFAAANRVFGSGAASNRVRLAIVGCREGCRGFSVMRAALKVPGVEIACVCDVDSRARAFAADYVQKATGLRPRMEKDLRKVLEDRLSDGIISETPDHFHAYSAVMAMRAGKAVYVEKPCCFCPDEGRILLQTAKETGMTLQVGSQRRASLSYRAALDWLKDTNAVGELRWAKAWYMADRASIGRGKASAVPEWLDWDLWQACAPREQFRDNIVHYNWHWFRKWGTSEMGNNAPHFADVSRWALGCDTFPESVTCSGGNFFAKDDDYEWPDTFNASFKYPNGKFITYELTSHCNEKPYMDLPTGVMVYGTKGAVYFTGEDGVKVYDEKSNLIREWKAGGVEMKAGEQVNTSDPTGGLDVLHLTDFVERIRERSQATRACADVGVKSSVMPLLANIALDCGETLRLDPTTGACLSKAGADKWAREYEKGWELV